MAGRFAGWRNLSRRSRGLSLRTLVILRWLAIAGQSATILVATAFFHFDLPLWPCLAVIGASVAMNLWATTRLKPTDGRFSDGSATAAHLGFDILQLTALLALTGGLENPFCLLLVAPVTVSAASLPARQAILLGLLVLLATIGLFFWAMPLPWEAGTELNLPPLYRFGTALALITGVVFTATYAILKKLSQQPEAGDALYADVGLEALLEEVVEPHRGFDLDFTVAVLTPPGEPAPRVQRMPEVIHGLSALVENAADFANNRVRVQARVEADTITIEVVDDGPGFAGEILPRLGEPYVTSRPQGKARQALAAQIAAARPTLPGRKGKKGKKIAPAVEIAPSQGGMGLGFFIARTLLERTGGTVTVGTGDGEKGQPKGARVTIRWPRPALEMPSGGSDTLTAGAPHPS